MLPVIREQLAGKRIFITGTTGFLGTNLLERLLRSVPDCDVVLLIRPGRRSSIEQRLQREILKNDAFDRLRTDHCPGADGKKGGAFAELAARRITPVAQSALPADAAIEAATETVLVAEDESGVRSVLVRALRSRGYEVLEAKNGEDALLVAERHNAPIHLVVTDVVMPSMNGTELFHALRGWYPRMRVLFISGYAKSTIPPDAFVEGQGAAFLAKPFTVEQLLTEVRRLLQAPRKSGAPV
jgi:CheY-like chemotaxis protein